MLYTTMINHFAADNTCRVLEFDNAAHVSFIGTVYYSVFISMERSTV